MNSAAFQGTVNGTVNDWASRSFRAILVVEKYGIDFHDHGNLSFDEVCRQKGLDPAAIAAEIESVSQPRQSVPIDPAISLRDLVAHINLRHHEYLKFELPRLRARLDRMAMRHPDRDGALLPQVRDAFVQLQSELELHLHKEEDILFPSILRLESAALAGESAPPTPFGAFTGPIRVMETDHSHAQDLLANLRRTARDYAAPAYACANFRAVFSTLRELEADLLEHIRVENEILHPRTQALEAQISA